MKKNHAITYEEIAIPYKVQLAADVDAQLSRKELSMLVTPGRVIRYIVSKNGVEVFSQFDIEECIEKYNSVIL